MSKIEKYYNNAESDEEVITNILYDIALSLQKIAKELADIKHN